MSFRIINNASNPITLLLIELSSSDPGINSENLADEEAKPPTNSLNLLQCKGHCPLPINVGVQDTMNMLEISIWIFNHK